MSKFVHLHNHSEYSLLDGLSKISKLIQKTKEYGQTAVALTDHGNMYGAIDFYKKATAENIKPIIGCEVYVAQKSRFDKQKQDASHLLLLAKDYQGYQNLMKISTAGYLEGFYYKPRVDKEILQKYHQGIIATTACLASQVNQLIVKDDLKSAKKELQELEQIFGSGNLYIELQRHHFDQYSRQDNVPKEIKGKLLEIYQKEQKAEKELIKFSRELGIPLIATNDVHYLEKEDARAQDAIVCVQTGKLTSDINRLRFVDTPDFYFKSPEEMEQEFQDLPEAIKNTGKIADQVDIKISLGQWCFPKIDLPKGKTAGEVLRKMAYQGAKERFGEITEEIKKRLDYELDVIDKKGYSAYFLLYSDLVEYCEKAEIYTNTRGSAAGSLVSYCCGITTVDPLRFNLPFERFLNPFRPSPPDIDLDVSDDQRDRVIEYLKEKYGQEKVAQICTFGTMKARAAIRDIGRVLGLPYSEVDKISKLVPAGSQGFPMTLDKALEITPELSQIEKSDPRIKDLLDLSKKVEGNTRHISVHAAAVVVSPDKLTQFTPLQFEPGGDKKIITQYEMHACEDVGLIKLDVLGIRNLSILANAVKLVKIIHNQKIDIHQIPLDDKKTLEILCNGETFGIFQLSSSGMTKYLMELKPEKIDDIMAMVALYRPGPMAFIPEYIKRRHNPKLVKYFDPRMEEFLDTSYGIITYQDDVLYIAIKLAGYNWEEADKFRKAIGKKIPEEMKRQHTKFVEGAIKNGMSRERAEDLFSQIETFAAYGFNKAHAASYGIVAYWTAYVKAHYPVEYMTALMSAEATNTDKLIEAINECENLGIRVLPPDINESLTDFTVVDIDKDQALPTGRAKDQGKAIRFGLNAVKNVGGAALESILQARKAGPFNSFSDFLSRVNLQKVNKKVVESLIKVGAFDRFGPRTALLAYLPQARDAAIKLQKEKLSGQVSLFGSAEKSLDGLKDKLPKVEEAPLAEILKNEKELLGVYLTDHPIKFLSSQISDRLTHKLNQLSTNMKGQSVSVAGIIASLRLVNTKKNNSRMAFATLEDEVGKINIIVFPKLFKETAQIWQEDKPVFVTGRIDNRDDELSLIVEKVEELNDDFLTNQPEILEIPRGTDKKTMIEISQILKENPGNQSVTIVIKNGGNDKRINLPYKVNLTESIKKKIASLL